MKKRDRISKSMAQLRGRMFLMWMVSILIPIIIIVLYNYMIYGPKSISFFTNPEFFNQEVWQMERYNFYEATAKHFNNLILENPDSVLDEEKQMDLKNSKEIKGFEMIVLIRKNNHAILVNDLNTETGKEIIESMKRLESGMLPEFKGGSETKNREMFLETGYVVSRQIDFYFNDGDEGSIFLIRKFTNIPGTINQVIVKNLILIIFVMMMIQAVFSYKMSRHITRPIYDMITATNHVRDGNYDYRMKSRSRGILDELILALNHMIVDLDMGQRYRKQIEETRQEFLANVSHDLKTPMTSIKIHIDAIRDGVVNTPAKMDKYLFNIQKKVQDMDGMLEELKTFSGLETGMGNYAFNIVNLKAVLEDIIDEFRYDIGERQIELTYSADLPEGEIVEIDVEKMKRVVLNIITNAIKYSEKEPIIIDIALKNVVYNDVPGIQLSIKDNGIGIPKEKIGKIFDKFYRVDEARSQEKSGSGLGLAIAKTIIEQHGGKIEAKSGPDEGLEILITLQRV